ncbi:MAG TPA: hypothetical protein VFN64_09565 [Burkholderiaceae bacterium]|nr:hypothetical protein [Burkholderiaceae bacterium]
MRRFNSLPDFGAVVAWLHERHETTRLKKLTHIMLIAWIGVMLLHEGGGAADWGFLVLALACEA